MKSPVLKEEMVLSGVVDSTMVSEFHSWGSPIEEALNLNFAQTPKSVEEALERIRIALESRDQVEIRSTDLDLMRYYFENQQEAKLHLEDPDSGQKSNVKVFFAWSKTGEVIIPWRSEGIQGLMLNPESYLLVEGKKLFFGTAQELFFGEQKTFMLCSIAEVEEKNV